MILLVGIKTDPVLLYFERFLISQNVEYLFLDQSALGMFILSGDSNMTICLEHLNKFINYI